MKENSKKKHKHISNNQTHNDSNFINREFTVSRSNSRNVLHRKL